MHDGTLKEWLNTHYDFEVVSISLLRSYTNDVYVIEVENKKYIVKLHSHSWRNKSEVLWEIDLITFLAAHELPVAKFIQPLSGKLHTYHEHSVVVTEYASGTKPESPFTPNLYHSVGQLAARIHEVTGNFQSEYSRPEYSLVTLIDNSLPFWKERVSPNDYAGIVRFADRLKQRIDIFVDEGLDWGVIHGDLTMDNLHITDDGSVILYDFDSSGFGWRAMELQGWVMLYPEKQSNIDAYLSGYLSVRKINNINIQAAPYFQAAQEMWLSEGMKALAEPRILHSQLQKIKEWVDYFRNSI